MFSFCHHCGDAIDQEQVVGEILICQHCRQTIGVVLAAPRAVVIDQTEELIRQGVVARCAVCQQTVEVKVRGAMRSLVPHAAKGEPRKVCPGGGKLMPAAKEAHYLKAYMTTDVISVIRFAKGAEPTIEALTLDYLDKADRVRLQIEAVRELLGASFRMQDYPPSLGMPTLAVWRSAEACVVAKRNPQGGYQAMSASEISQVLDDIRLARATFFA